MDEKNQELSNCNFVKTILMITVILDHSLAFWTAQGWFNQKPINKSPMLGIISMWLGTFNVCAFTLVSGYIFYAMKYEYLKYSNYSSFIINKVKRLLLPYGFVSIMWVIPSSILWYGSEEIVKKYLFMESPSQLWFLVMLFGVFLLYYVISDFINRHIFFGGV